MGRKLGLLVAMFVLCLPASALAQDTASTALNILPSGQSEDASAPGATRQAQMYNALTPLRDNITDAQLPTYFKSEALDPGNTIVRTETIPSRPGVEIRRDALDVPHIYGQTDDDVTFGAGYAIAEDRNLLLNQARFDSLTAAIDAPGLSAIDLVSNLYQFAPSKQTERIVSRQTRVLRKAGPKGVQLLHDIDTYLAGINAWYSANQPSVPRFTRNDIYALNALKGQFLGQGGGGEIDNAEFLDGLQRKFGSSRGLDVFEDLKGRDDPATETTLSKPAPWNPLPSSRKGVVGHQERELRVVGAEAGRGGPPRDPQPGQQHPRGLGLALGHGAPAVRRRPADLVLLPRARRGDGPARPEHRRARRHLGPVPRLHAHRPRRELRLDADLGRRRHHRSPGRRSSGTGSRGSSQSGPASSFFQSSR